MENSPVFSKTHQTVYDLFQSSAFYHIGKLCQAGPSLTEAEGGLQNKNKKQGVAQMQITTQYQEAKVFINWQR